MTRLITLNIGLNNNLMNTEEIANHLNQLRGYNLWALKEAESTYLGDTKPTLVVELSTNYTRDSRIIQDIENLASTLEQECIGVQTKTFEHLVYAPNFNGERMKFNSDFFIPIITINELLEE